MNNDPHDDTNLERRQDLRRDEEAFRLQQEENRLGTAQQTTTFMWIVNSIYWLAGMLEILLVLRFLLRLFGANPDNEFAQLINNLSTPFMAPFSTLFISPTTAGAANTALFSLVRHTRHPKYLLRGLAGFQACA